MSHSLVGSRLGFAAKAPDGRVPEVHLGLKIKQEGQTAGFGPCFLLPGFHFGIPVF